MPTPVKEIRALERGLTVLEILQRHQGSTLQQLHVATQFPKSTLRRILKTLEKCGLVCRSLSDQLYRANVIVTPQLIVEHRYDYLVAAASPVLDELSRRLYWPSDLVVCTGSRMEVLETTRFSSSLSINICRKGERISLVHSAVGRAYLAFCPEEERKRILGDLSQASAEGEPLLHNGSSLERQLAEVRAQGYAAREKGYTGSTSFNPQGMDGLQAIAVPILRDGSIHGCINLVWPARAFSARQFAARYLPDLQDAAATIARRLEHDAPPIEPEATPDT